MTQIAHKQDDKVGQLKTHLEPLQSQFRIRRQAFKQCNIHLMPKDPQTVKTIKEVMLKTYDQLKSESKYRADGSSAEKQDQASDRQTSKTERDINSLKEEYDENFANISDLCQEINSDLEQLYDKHLVYYRDDLYLTTIWETQSRIASMEKYFGFVKEKCIKVINEEVKLDPQKLEHDIVHASQLFKEDLGKKMPKDKMQYHYLFTRIGRLIAVKEFLIEAKGRIQNLSEKPEEMLQQLIALNLDFNNKSFCVSRASNQKYHTVGKLKTHRGFDDDLSWDMQEVTNSFVNRVKNNIFKSGIRDAKYKVTLKEAQEGMLKFMLANLEHQDEAKFEASQEMMLNGLCMLRTISDNLDKFVKKAHKMMKKCEGSSKEYLKGLIERNANHLHRIGCLIVLLAAEIDKSAQAYQQSVQDIYRKSKVDGALQKRVLNKQKLKIEGQKTHPVARHQEDLKELESKLDERPVCITVDQVRDELKKLVDFVNHEFKLTSKDMGGYVDIHAIAKDILDKTSEDRFDDAVAMSTKIFDNFQSGVQVLPFGKDGFPFDYLLVENLSVEIKKLKTKEEQEHAYKKKLYDAKTMPQRHTAEQVQQLKRAELSMFAEDDPYENDENKAKEEEDKENAKKLVYGKIKPIENKHVVILPLHKIGVNSEELSPDIKAQLSSISENVKAMLPHTGTYVVCQLEGKLEAPKELVIKVMTNTEKGFEFDLQKRKKHFKTLESRKEEISSGHVEYFSDDAVYKGMVAFDIAILDQMAKDHIHVIPYKAVTVQDMINSRTRINPLMSLMFISLVARHLSVTHIRSEEFLPGTLLLTYFDTIKLVKKIQEEQSNLSQSELARCYKKLEQNRQTLAKATKYVLNNIEYKLQFGRQYKLYQKILIDMNNLDENLPSKLPKG